MAASGNARRKSAIPSAIDASSLKQGMSTANRWPPAKRRGPLWATAVSASLIYSPSRQERRLRLIPYTSRPCRSTIAFLCSSVLARSTSLAVIVPFESRSLSSIDRLIELVRDDMTKVNNTILARTGSQVTMIPEVANHLISSGGKRLRPILTLAMARLAGYAGEGHVKLAAAVEFMHTATLLHDD